MEATYTSKQMGRRAAQIMRAVRQGGVSPTSDTIAELAALTQALEDQPVKPIVLARMTVIRENGSRIIVEVEDGSNYSTFFKFYRQVGARRSTKEFIRHGYRGEAGNIRPCLENIASKLSLVQITTNPVVDVKIRILRKRAFRKLMTARPDELGLTKTAPLPIYRPVVRSLSSSSSLGGSRSA